MKIITKFISCVLIASLIWVMIPSMVSAATDPRVWTDKTVFNVGEEVYVHWEGATVGASFVSIHQNYGYETGDPRIDHGSFDSQATNIARQYVNTESGSTNFHGGTNENDKNLRDGFNYLNPGYYMAFLVIDDADYDNHVYFEFEVVGDMFAPHPTSPQIIAQRYYLVGTDIEISYKNTAHGDYLGIWAIEDCKDFFVGHWSTRYGLAYFDDMNYPEGSTSFIGTTEDIKSHRAGDLVDGYLPVGIYRVGLFYDCDPTGAFAVHYVDIEVVNELPAEPEIAPTIEIVTSETAALTSGQTSEAPPTAPRTGYVSYFVMIGLFISASIGIGVFKNKKRKV